MVPIIETSTMPDAYPNIVNDPDTVIKVRDLFLTGSKAKIRIIYGRVRTVTYTLDLEGFNSASQWVEGCLHR